MAERKAGPVKPPILDLTARAVDPAAEALRRSRSGGRTRAAAPASIEETPAQPPLGAPQHQPETPTATPEPTAANPVPPRSAVPPGDSPATSGNRGDPASQSRWPLGPLAATALIAALLGAALTYAVATLVPLPQRPGTAMQDTLAAQEQRLGALEEANAALADQAQGTQARFDGALTTLEARLNEIGAAAEGAAAAAAEPPGIPELRSRLQSLSARIDAIAAGASSADADALAQSVGAVRASLSDLTARLAGIEDARAGTDAALREVQAALAELRQAQQQRADAEATAAAPVVRAEVAADLELAFASGRPFAPALAALGSGSPDIGIPAELRDRAETGLPRPDDLAQRFAARVPEMLAARPAAPAAGWQDAAVTWLTGLLAIRPSGEQAGDDPEAVMARLETAVERRDFGTASELLALLPEPMRAAAGDVPPDVAAWAAAQALLAQLRANTGDAAQ